MPQTREDILKPMTCVIQYTRKDDGSGTFDPWHTMAAFDVRGPAERYAAECTNDTWEYRVIDLPETED